MHELSVIQNLVSLVKDICQKERAKKVVCIEITIHPYSCLDEANLNFMFSSVVGDDILLKDAKIKIKRSKDFQDREYIVDNIEVEVE